LSVNAGTIKAFPSFDIFSSTLVVVVVVLGEVSATNVVFGCCRWIQLDLDLKNPLEKETGCSRMS
jgi:hypothetical protein